MRRIGTSLATILFATGLFAQTNANWTWGHANANAKITINPIVVQQSVAAHGNRALWGNIINMKHLSNQQYGDCEFTEYDTSGTALNSVLVTGKLAIIASQADAAGNWYVLGQYEDSVQIPGGPLLLKTPGGSDYCMFRLNSGTLSCGWIKPIGIDFFTTATCFTVANNQIYIPIDSSNIARISKLDLATGAETRMWYQSGQNMVTSIQADSKGNVYLVGSCAFSGMDFNGHQVTLPGTFQYPQYIVRYKSDGTYDWSQFMQDGTCFVREFSLADDNTIYYTGPVNDTLTLGNLHLSKPPAFGSYMVAKMDSTGNFNWARQLVDTASGEAQFVNSRQAGIGPNGSIIIYTSTRGYVNWGNNITSVTTPGWKYTGSVVSYDGNGDVLWANDLKASFVTPQQMAISGDNVWVTGNAFDSTQITLGSINVPLPGGPFAYYPFVARLRNSAITSQVPDLITEPSIVIIPNPAAGHFAVKTQGHNQVINVALYDNVGRLAWSGATVSNEHIDVSSLPRGLYFVEVNDKGAKTVRKLLLQ